jgi:triosephosphate isomerase
MVEKRRSLVSGNWKMHEDHLESVKLVQGIAALLNVKHLPLVVRRVNSLGG